jgi:hypothetical protein
VVTCNDQVSYEDRFDYDKFEMFDRMDGHFASSSQDSKNLVAHIKINK